VRAAVAYLPSPCGDALVAEAAHPEQMPLSDIQYEQVERAKANIADARALLYAAIEQKMLKLQLKRNVTQLATPKIWPAEVSHCICRCAHT